MTDLAQLTARAQKVVAALAALDTSTIEAKRERFLAYGRVLLAIREQIPDKRKFGAYLKANGLALRSSHFRSNAMWVARRWDDLSLGTSHCPYADPNRIHQWASDQERIAKGLPERAGLTKQRKPATAPADAGDDPHADCNRRLASEKQHVDDLRALLERVQVANFHLDERLNELLVTSAAVPGRDDEPHPSGAARYVVTDVDTLQKHYLLFDVREDKRSGRNASPKAIIAKFRARHVLAPIAQDQLIELALTLLVHRARESLKAEEAADHAPAV